MGEVLQVCVCLVVVVVLVRKMLRHRRHGSHGGLLLCHLHGVVCELRAQLLMVQILQAYGLCS